MKKLFNSKVKSKKSKHKVVGGRWSVIRVLLFLTLCLCASVVNIPAQSTEFTYQGRVLDGSVPPTASYDFEFSLWDSLVAGAQHGSTQTVTGVAVSNGIFTVKLNFGAQFDGNPKFLQIAMRSAGGGAYTTLAPRQAITSGPYAIRSLSSNAADTATTATTANDALNLGGVAASQFVQTTDPRMTDARTPTAGSGNYIQNGTTQQATSSFNISGTGTANIFSAAGGYRIGGNIVLRIGGAGTNNLFAGPGAGVFNTGFNNSFFGYSAGAENTTGINSAFFGMNAGPNNTTGSGNSFFGALAGFSSTTGGNNAFFGLQAGDSNTTGSSNTIIGGSADVLSNNLTNATAVGYRAAVGANNSLVLGSINAVNGATADTNVGIGTTTPSYPFSVVGTTGIGSDQAAAEFSSSVNDTGIRIRNTATNGRTWTLFSSGGTTGLCQGCFSIYDVNAGFARITVDSSGNVGLGSSNPQERLNVNGNIALLLESGGSTSVCQNSTNFRLATCSSSLRYKTNIGQFSQGMSFVNKLRPITFDWKDGGLKDVGFGAEDIAKIDPRFVTFNSKGEVEGVKYDRLSVAFVNAFKEQQAQIETQQSAISRQQSVIEQQQKQIDALKKLVCAQNPTAEICKEEK